MPRSLNSGTHYLVQLSNLLQPGRLGILRPAAEQLSTLVLHGRIAQVRGAADPQALQQGLVGKGPLEARAGVLDEPVEDDERAQLTVGVAILELLADGTGSFGGAGGLQLNDLDELGDAAEVILLVLLRREVLDGDGDRRVWLLL